jgi:hypothetical protein
LWVVGNYHPDSDHPTSLSDVAQVPGNTAGIDIALHRVSSVLVLFLSFRFALPQAATPPSHGASHHLGSYWAGFRVLDLILNGYVRPRHPRLPPDPNHCEPRQFLPFRRSPRLARCSSASGRLKGAGLLLSEPSTAGMLVRKIDTGSTPVSPLDPPCLPPRYFRLLSGKTMRPFMRKGSQQPGLSNLQKPSAARVEEAECAERPPVPDPALEYLLAQALRFGGVVRSQYRRLGVNPYRTGFHILACFEEWFHAALHRFTS